MDWTLQVSINLLDTATNTAIVTDNKTLFLFVTVLMPRLLLPFLFDFLSEPVTMAVSVAMPGICIGFMWFNVMKVKFLP